MTHEARLVKMAAFFAGDDRAACLAGADALRREGQACGSCRHLARHERWGGAPGETFNICDNPQAVAVGRNVATDDACRKGWAPQATAQETGEPR